ncbi:MAG TPA: LacI family DNA-binding transcriptional regulator [Acidimicrobiales bacterium]|nr:LacI family DNA-binding transcriptional regulator [Acidimicrobiales bacterium]
MQVDQVTDGAAVRPRGARRQGDGARKGTTTIVDVARAAGVSTATVSRVLNDHPKVDAGLRSRVLRAVKELGYRPSRVARSLRTRRNRVWALIISDVRTGPFFADVVRGVEDIAYGAGYSIFLCNADENAAKEASYIELAVAENVAGLILTPSSERTDLSPLIHSGIPVVLADRSLPSEYADTVTVDNISGAYQAVSHLLAGGFKRIACITGPLQTTTGERRYVGYCKALAEAGRAVDEALVRVADFREAGGSAAMRDLLQEDRRPDAVFVTNHLMAIGALQEIDQAGLLIPDDVAIVSFDDMSWSTLLRPPLTAVAQPAYDLGVESARLLLSRLEGYSGTPRLVTLSPALVVRASSTPVKRPANRRASPSVPHGNSKEGREP